MKQGTGSKRQGSHLLSVQRKAFSTDSRRGGGEGWATCQSCDPCCGCQCRRTEQVPISPCPLAHCQWVGWPAFYTPILGCLLPAILGLSLTALLTASLWGLWLPRHCLCLALLTAAESLPWSPAEAIRQSAVLVQEFQRLACISFILFAEIVWLWGWNGKFLQEREKKRPVTPLDSEHTALKWTQGRDSPLWEGHNQGNPISYCTLSSPSYP